MQRTLSIKITLVDDDPMMRSMLEDFLKEKYPQSEISSWSNGEDALKNTSEHQDLIVLDYILDAEKKGSMNGIEIFKRIRSQFPEVPVVFISGQEESKVAVSALMHGAHDYLVKNENVFQRLDETLIKILGKPRTQSDNNNKSGARILWAILVVLLAAFALWKFVL